MLNMQLRLKDLRIVLKWCLHREGNCCQKKEVPEHKMMEYIAYLVPRPVYDNISTPQLHCLQDLDANTWAVKLAAVNPKYYKIPLKQNKYHLVNHLIYLIFVIPYIYIFPKRVRYGKKQHLDSSIHLSDAKDRVSLLDALSQDEKTSTAQVGRGENWTSPKWLGFTVGF